MNLKLAYYIPKPNINIMQKELIYKALSNLGCTLCIRKVHLDKKERYFAILRL